MDPAGAIRRPEIGFVGDANMDAHAHVHRHRLDHHWKSEPTRQRRRAILRFRGPLLRDRYAMIIQQMRGQWLERGEAVRRIARLVGKRIAKAPSPHALSKLDDGYVLRQSEPGNAATVRFAQQQSGFYRWNKARCRRLELRDEGLQRSFDLPRRRQRALAHTHGAPAGKNPKSRMARFESDGDRPLRYALLNPRQLRGADELALQDQRQVGRQLGRRPRRTQRRYSRRSERVVDIPDCHVYVASGVGKSGKIERRRDAIQLDDKNDRRKVEKAVCSGEYPLLDDLHVVAPAPPVHTKPMPACHALP